MSRLLDPKILLSIKNLQLAARTTVGGFLSGINKSKIRGEGLEFSQYRSYQPGDDLRQLDWKAYARSDRYYIRESAIETSLSVRFVLDASGSMNHEDNGYTKMEYAKYLTAALAWLAGLQGDAVGLYVLQSRELLSMEPQRDYRHMTRFWHQLEAITATGGIPGPDDYKAAFARASKKELVVFITDVYEQDAEIFSALESLGMMRHEIIVFHLMGKNELEFNYGAYTTLEDLETGRQVNINTGRDKANHAALMEQHLAAIRVKMLNRGIAYRLLNMQQTVELALRDFLQQRLKLTR